MSVPLLVGEAPGKHVPGKGVAVGAPPLAGKVGAFLRRLYGVPEPLSDYFDLANVFSYYPASLRPPIGKGAPFPLLEASAAVEELHRRNEKRVVVVLGRRIPVAMTKAGPPCSVAGPWYEWRTWRTWLWVPIPHPSGLNRLYNDPSHRTSARETLEHAVELAHELLPDAIAATARKPWL